MAHHSRRYSSSWRKMFAIQKELLDMRFEYTQFARDFKLLPENIDNVRVFYYIIQLLE